MIVLVYVKDHHNPYRSLQLSFPLYETVHTPGRFFHWAPLVGISCWHTREELLKSFDNVGQANHWNLHRLSVGVGQTSADPQGMLAVYGNLPSIFSDGQNHLSTIHV